MSCSCAFAQTNGQQAPNTDGEAQPANAEQEEHSPWLLAPVLKSDPKLGTAFGALAGYLHYFDPKSRPSIFAVTVQYSNTDSLVAGAFARTSFDEDRQRLLAALMYGYIKND